MMRLFPCIVTLVCFHSPVFDIRYVAKLVAKQEGLDKTGFRIVINDGEQGYVCTPARQITWSTSAHSLPCADLTPAPVLSWPPCHLAGARLCSTSTFTSLAASSWRGPLGARLHHHAPLALSVYSCVLL